MFVFLFVVLCFFYSCFMFEKLDNIKFYFLCFFKFDEDIEVRDDIIVIFVIKVKFGILFESIWVGFYMLYVR